MGSVWRAEHVELGTPAAVKLVDEEIVRSPEALARFKREAQAAASLRSVNVVQILDYGLDGETPFIAMELLDGESLADRLARVGRLDPATTAGILGQVAKAVGRAHDAGIVHRDLKPDNIYLVRDGDDEVAKVLDFGIAKRSGALAQSTGGLQTRTGSLLGTPYYMSPEQATGRKQVDARTDIWAMCVIAFECITGSRPFDDENLGGLLLQICSEAAPVPSSRAAVPEGFDQWFARGTARNPEDRFASAREAAAELSRIALGSAGPRPTFDSVDNAYLPISPAQQMVSVARAQTGGVATGIQTKPGQPHASTTVPASMTLGVPQRSSRVGLAIGLVVGAVLALGAVGIVWSRTNATDPAAVDSAEASPQPQPAAAARTLEPPATPENSPAVVPVEHTAEAPTASAAPSNAEPPAVARPAARRSYRRPAPRPATPEVAPVKPPEPKPEPKPAADKRLDSDLGI